MSVSTGSFRGLRAPPEGLMRTSLLGEKSISQHGGTCLATSINYVHWGIRGGIVSCTTGCPLEIIYQNDACLALTGPLSSLMPTADVID